MNSLVIIPTFNERENVDAAVRGAIAAHPSVSVLVVDDRSSDGTGRIADSLAAEMSSRVFVLHRAGKYGLGSAYLEGFRFGFSRGFDLFFEMDADGSHDPADLARLIAAAADADVVIGSRRAPGGKIIGWGVHRHVLSAGAMSIARFFLDLKTRDVTAGFRCYRRAVVERLLTLPIASNGYAFQEETLFYCERFGFRIAEVPVTFRDRMKGESKMSFAEAMGFFATVARLRNYRLMGGNADDGTQPIEHDHGVVGADGVALRGEEPVE